MVTCGFCGREFEENRGQPTCVGCPLSDGCHFRRCPHCGYENPASPAWVGLLKRWLAGDDARRDVRTRPEAGPVDGDDADPRRASRFQLRRSA